MTFFAALFCQQFCAMSAYKFLQRAIASPDAPQKLLIRKRARSESAEWVRVTRDRPDKASKPRSVRSQQPSCKHPQHQILNKTEVAAFQANFLDRKQYPSKAAQRDFLANCMDVVMDKVKHARRQKCTRKRGHLTTHFIPYRGARREICKTRFLHYFNVSRCSPISCGWDHRGCCEVLILKPLSSRSCRVSSPLAGFLMFSMANSSSRGKSGLMPPKVLQGTQSKYCTAHELSQSSKCKVQLNRRNCVSDFEVQGGPESPGVQMGRGSTRAREAESGGGGGGVSGLWDTPCLRMRRPVIQNSRSVHTLLARPHSKHNTAKSWAVSSW